MLEYIAFNQVNEKIRTDIWNDGFSDYLRPIHMSIEQLNNRVSSLHLSGDYSFVVFENGIAKGITLYGVKEFNGVKTCWIGGLAVHPNYRKEGIAIAMLDYSEKMSKELGVNLVTLEVIAANERALKLYLREGYKNARQVSFLKGTINNKDANSNLILETVSHLTDATDLTIPWQNRIFHGYQQAILKENGNEIGSMVYHVNGNVIQIFQLSLGKDYVPSLLAYLKEKLAIETVVGVNLLSDSEEVLALIESGIVVDLDQYQLEKKYKNV